MKQILVLITLLSSTIVLDSLSMQLTERFQLFALSDSFPMTHINRVNWKPGLNHEWPVLPIKHNVAEVKQNHKCKSAEYLKKSNDIDAEKMVNQLIQDSEDDATK